MTTITILSQRLRPLLIYIITIATRLFPAIRIAAEIFSLAIITVAVILFPMDRTIIESVFLMIVINYS